MSFVTSTQEGSLLTMTLDRPEALNALNAQVLDDLDAALDTVDLSTVRCIIFTGAGNKAFAAGADIAAMAGMDPEEAAAFSRRGNEVFRRIETFPLPTVAAVNGYALGGGCELAMACDIRLCSENAVFGQPEVTLGITPGFGGTQRLKRTGQMLLDFFIPLVAGGVLSIAMVMQHHYGLTSSIMLIFYGLALINCSHYTYPILRYLGYAELLLGLIDCFMVSHALLFWFLGFSVLHIIFGIIYVILFDCKKA